VILTAESEAARARFRAFAEEHLVPGADRFDQEEATPPDVIDALRSTGYLGALVPPAYGGAGLDMLTVGLLNEELGRGCSSVRSLLTVHAMVTFAVLRWGAPAQRERWLPSLARGAVLGAFALSEPSAGSDANAIEMQAVAADGGYRLSGHKKWITYGQIADVFLVFAKVDGHPTAFLVEASSPGLTRAPIRQTLGLRASMLARVDLADCFVPTDQRIGGVGFGCALVAASCLEHGRYSVAWGCVGASQACLEATVRHTRSRAQHGQRLESFQLVRRLVSDMATGVHASRLVCAHAGKATEQGHAMASAEIAMAKYFASTTFARVASDAVQLHGAAGCSSEHSVQRHFRDSKVMEIIEGASEIHQTTIASSAYEASA
jgi:alkylation response protein AidB-like acyl-CoA dehydrogenase